MNKPNITPDDHKEVKVYIKVILYYLRHEGLSEREAIRRCIYTARQMLPFLLGDKRRNIVEYIKTFIDTEHTKEQKIERLQAELNKQVDE